MGLEPFRTHPAAAVPSKRLCRFLSSHSKCGHIDLSLATSPSPQGYDKQLCKPLIERRSVIPIKEMDEGEKKKIYESINISLPPL